MYKAIVLAIALIYAIGLSASTSLAKNLPGHDHSMKPEKAAKLVKCPVTGSTIDPAKAYSKTVYKGKTYYFCCAGCPEEFKKNPEKYLKKGK